jgi:hypothetical protein
MTHERFPAALPVLLALLLLLACAPGFGGDDEPGAVQISTNWQCPTPSPAPTREIGSGPTAEPPPEATYVPGQEPTGEPLYSTPMPTATPYIRTGSDYFINQRIQIDTITIRVTGYQTQPAPSAGQQLHLVTIELENPNPVAVPLLFDLSQLRTIKGTDGRTIQGEWYHDARAAQAAGISPAADPELDEDANGQIAGGYPPGTTRRTLVFVGPAGDAQTWGMAFSDADTPRDGGAGSNQVWVLLRADPNCTAGPGGGAGSGGEVPPGAPPATGSGRWPVPLDTPISRGYGCASFFTGTRGPCSGDTPWWHDGIDFAKPVGTPLFATRDMTVLFAGVDGSTIDCSDFAPQNDPPYAGFGQYIKTQDTQDYVYWYGHVSRWRVNAGQQVTAGTQVGDMGKTGCSTGSHLHFRVRLNGLDRNPMDVIAK